MKIGYLGAGSWGFCLAVLLAGKGYDVVLWTSRKEFADELNKTRKHPRLPQCKPPTTLRYTSDLREAVEGADFIVESVTSAGLRPVLQQIKQICEIDVPFVVTSKGIEQDTGLLLPEVAHNVLGEESRPWIGCLSGPSHAEEVVQKLPSSVVSSAYDKKVMLEIQEAFNTPVFRVYPNADINGVAFGGAMKNIMAIACGISDGLGFGDNTKAALMTRGLHEIRKLAPTKGCHPDTLYGLSGMGDLCVTCLSRHSRNYRFGKLIAEGLDPKKAKEEIGMAVEGSYTCLSALQIGQKAKIPVPITEAIYRILYEDLNPHEAVRALLNRIVKEEHL